jgi:hypothetical protein
MSSSAAHLAIEEFNRSLLLKYDAIENNFQYEYDDYREKALQQAKQRYGHDQPTVHNVMSVMDKEFQLQSANLANKLTQRRKQQVAAFELKLQELVKLNNPATESVRRGSKNVNGGIKAMKKTDSTGEKPSRTHLSNGDHHNHSHHKIDTNKPAISSPGKYNNEVDFNVQQRYYILARVLELFESPDQDIDSKVQQLRQLVTQYSNLPPSKANSPTHSHRETFASTRKHNSNTIISHNYLTSRPRSASPSTKYSELSRKLAVQRSKSAKSKPPPPKVAISSSVGNGGGPRSLSSNHYKQELLSVRDVRSRQIAQYDRKMRKLIMELFSPPRELFFRHKSSTGNDYNPQRHQEAYNYLNNSSSPLRHNHHYSFKASPNSSPQRRFQLDNTIQSNDFRASYGQEQHNLGGTAEAREIQLAEGRFLDFLE